MAVSELWGFAPELMLLAVGALLPLLGAFEVRERVLAGITVVAFTLAGYLTLGYAVDLPGLAVLQEAVAFYTPQGETAARFFISWSVDAFSTFFKLTFLLVSVLVALGSIGSIDSPHLGEYYGLLVLATVGTLAVASSVDLLTLFVGLELASFSTYALVAFYKSEESSTEAAMKYFIVGSLSSAIALYGISLVYGITGGVAFTDLAHHATTAELTSMTLFMWVFLFAGFGFKITAVPFHVWAPDTYEGSPSAVGGYLAAGTKKAGFVALFKIFLVGLVAIQASWNVLIALVAVATMTVGNVVALRQDDIKRMLAYSSVAHAGYMLIGIIVATRFAVAGSLFHILTHAFMTAGAFVAVGVLAAVGVGSTLDRWRGMARRSPALAFSVAIFMVSLAGIPPLAGFASKFVLFGGAIEAGGWFVWLAVAGIVNSAISLYYYAGVIRTMYVEDAPQGEAHRLDVPGWALGSVVVAAGLTLAVGLYPAPLVDLAFEAAQVLLT